MGILIGAATVCVVACGPGRPARSPEVGSSSEDRAATVLVSQEERAGESIFRRENCARCHTLFDRPTRSQEINLPGEWAVEDLGSRVGPDLGLEGHRRSDEWHYAHLYAPGELVPGSRMPPSRQLFLPEGGRPVPTPEGRQLVAYLQALGRGGRDLWAEWRRREPLVPAPPRVDAAILRRGDELYRRHCVACHGSEGNGRGALAEFFSFAPRDLVAARFTFRSAPVGSPPKDADLYRAITLGTGTTSAMPAFYWLPESDRWALVLRVKEFSAALRGSGLRTEESAPEPASVGRRDGDDGARGRLIWNSLGCASCHGPAGKGMTRDEAKARWTGVAVPRSGDLTHACDMRGGASDEAVRRAILFGVGEAMPSYADSLPDEESRRALVGFVVSLQSNPRMEATSRGTPDRP